MDSKKAMGVLWKFFGPREGETLKDFAKEVRALSEDERITLAVGIENGSFDY